MTNKKEDMKQILLRKIPSVEKILGRDDVAPLCTKYPRGMVLKALQNRLEKIRNFCSNAARETGLIAGAVF